MPMILTLESDPKQQEAVQTAITGISSHLVNKPFTTLEEFEKFVDALTAPKREDDQIAVLVLAADLLPHKDTIQWLKNLRQKLTSKGFGLADNPIRLFIQTFEDSHFHPQFFEIPEVFTYIIKPVDPLILKENLGFAVTGYKQLRGNEIKFRPVLDKLEMLKNIHFDEVSEVGFVTTSDTEFKPGAFSKYYSAFFNVGTKSSAFARLINCKAHPQKKGFYQCLFEFVGLENDQLQAMRKKLASMQTIHRKGDYVYPWFANHNNTPERPMVTVAVAIFDEVIRKPIVESLQRNFKNIRIVELDVLKEDFPNPIICDIALIDDLRNTEAFLKFFDLKTPKLLISKERSSESNIRDRVQFFSDIIPLPVDKAYLNKKIYLMNPSLKPQEVITNMAIHGGFDIKAVMPVQITQASENHVEFSYHRALPLNEIREFAIHGDESLIHTEIKGRCQFVGKNNNKELPHTHQFLLLGQKDFYTKQLRLWLHRLYVTEAEKKI